MDDNPFSNRGDYRAFVDAVRAEAAGLPTSAVAAPDMPVRTLLEEGLTAAAAVKLHFDALAEAGLTEAHAAALARSLLALQGAEALWRTTRCRCRSEALQRTLDEARSRCRFLMDASRLALRCEPDGLRRLSRMRDIAGRADLASTLGDLAVLISDYASLFEAVRLDPDALSKDAARLRDAVYAASAEEAVANADPDAKDLRDRCAVLAKRALAEVRAFARFAFRSDTSDERRGPFLSEYGRRRNQRHRNRHAPGPAAPKGNPSQ